MFIRLAQESDGVAIAAAERETAETPGLLVGRPGEITLGDYIRKITELADRGRYIVAEENGKTVGHAFLEPMSMAAIAHVFRLTIVVHPGWRDRGIGRAMLEDLLRWANEDSRVQKVELLVRAGNERAIQLYRSAGFVEEGRFRNRLRNVDGSYTDDLAMAWFPRNR